MLSLCSPFFAFFLNYLVVNGIILVIVTSSHEGAWTMAQAVDRRKGRGKLLTDYDDMIEELHKQGYGAVLIHRVINEPAYRIGDVERISVKTVSNRLRELRTKQEQEQSVNS